MNFSSRHNIFSWSQKEGVLVLEMVLILGEIRYTQSHFQKLDCVGHVLYVDRLPRSLLIVETTHSTMSRGT